MLSLQEISDRMEITDLVVRYSHAIDTRQWDLLVDIFTPDAVIDYTAMGGPRGGVEETISTGWRERTANGASRSGSRRSPTSG